jgi:hypothetical protein
MVEISKENERGGLRLYRNVGDRKKGMRWAIKRGYNYFVGFKDCNHTHPAGLSYGKADWVAEGKIYEKDVLVNRIIH